MNLNLYLNFPLTDLNQENVDIKNINKNYKLGI